MAEGTKRARRCLPATAHLAYNGVVMRNPRHFTDPRCWACRASIKPNQRICDNCSQWQDWRRYTAVSSTVLALLVALITVTGAVAPRLISLLVEPKILLDFAARVDHRCVDLPGCYREGSSHQTHYILQFTNFGDADVRLSKTMRCNGRGIPESLIEPDLGVPTFKTTDATLLAPNASASIDYAYFLFPFSEYKRFNSSSTVTCYLEITSRPGNYFVFDMVEDTIVIERGIEEIASADASGLIGSKESELGFPIV